MASSFSVPIPDFTMGNAMSGVARPYPESLTRNVGHISRLTFPLVASLADGVALTTLQTRVYIGVPHRIRGVEFAMSGCTAVAGGTDPACDVYRHLPTPDAMTAALVSPAAAGNVNAGAHKYAVTFVNAAGETTASDTCTATVANASVNGQVLVSGIPIGPTGTTQRKIYRTLAAGTALKLLATIADNTTTTYTDNIADATISGLAADPAANTAGATILSATVKMSTTGIRLLTDQPVAGVPADAAAPVIVGPCMYSLRVLTGATSGAIANVQATIEYEALA